MAAARMLAYAAVENRPVLRHVVCAAGKEMQQMLVAEVIILYLLLAYARGDVFQCSSIAGAKRCLYC